MTNNKNTTTALIVVANEYVTMCSAVAKTLAIIVKPTYFHACAHSFWWGMPVQFWFVTLSRSQAMATKRKWD